MALKHGVNANLLRKWVVRYQLACDAAALPSLPMADDAAAFVSVILNRGAVTPNIKHHNIPMGAAITEAAPMSPPPLLRARLPNGITLDFDCTDRDTAWLSRMNETLGRCDVSPRRWVKDGVLRTILETLARHLEESYSRCLKS